MSGMMNDVNSPEAQGRPMLGKQELGELQASNKWKWPEVEEILSYLNPWWNTILVSSCVIAVLFDPLFFYIPLIKEEEKCMGIDNQARTAALVLRSVTDIPFLVHIIYKLNDAITAASKVPRDTNPNSESGLVSRVQNLQMVQFVKACSRKLSWRSFLTDVFAVFPIPQLLMVGLFFNLGGSNYLLKRKILSSFLLLQYLPRIYRIYLSSITMTHSVLWVKAAFNLFLYILASHILGAFWYFFSIQRETSCWYQSCITSQPESKCTFYCHHRTTISVELNTTLNHNCVLKVPYYTDDPPFDFGIFFDALKNDIQGPINLQHKLVYCFWWGLRNLSNFGTNLQTSTHLLENTFVILISVTGLLLFLYLIGNLQIYIAKATTKAEEVREKFETKRHDIEKWMTQNGLEEDMKAEIRRNIKQKLEEDISVDLDDIISILPWYTRKPLKRALCMNTLRRVPMLNNMDEKVLKLMCDYLKPMKYQENHLVFKMGDPLDRMVFITEGVLWTYKAATKSTGEAIGLPTSASIDTNVLKKGDSYGHELLLYASSYYKIPTSPKNLRCHTKVEAFVLMANDLTDIVNKCKSKNLWSLDNDASNDEARDRVAPLKRF
ncbi:hypothetical protein ACLB2K_033457 [Fragaria x ananassa]